MPTENVVRPSYSLVPLDVFCLLNRSDISGIADSFLYKMSAIYLFPSSV
jgi:hypothetical protein